MKIVKILNLLIEDDFFPQFGGGSVLSPTLYLGKKQQI